MSLKNTCACMEKSTGGKTSGTRRGTILCSTIQVDILRHSLAHIMTLSLWFIATAQYNLKLLKTVMVETTCNLHCPSHVGGTAAQQLGLVGWIGLVV